MYISITAQKLGATYAQSSAEFVEYLEKENQGLEKEAMEHFFNQDGDEISAAEVVREIDGNAAKLKKKEPKFYSITVNPSKRELQKLNNNREDLKRYTRALMQDYASSFNRQINNRPVTVDDIKYYAKIEHQRTYKGSDKQVQENQSYASKILIHKQEIRKIERGEATGDISKLKDKIDRLERTAPHQIRGKRIVQGMKKGGNQLHIHIIVSRKDKSNSYSLSPGSKYKSSETVFNGKKVGRGFDRDAFFEKAEKRFDKTFEYKRNYAESYQSKKDFIKNPKMYFATLLGLPTNERAIAFKILGKSDVPIASIPTTQVQFALKVIRRLKRGVDIAIKSSSIGI